MADPGTIAEELAKGVGKNQKVYSKISYVPTLNPSQRSQCANCNLPCICHQQENKRGVTRPCAAAAVGLVKHGYVTDANARGSPLHSEPRVVLDRSIRRQQKRQRKKIR